jgi:NUMOD4 motif
VTRQPEEEWKPVARDEDGREYPGYEVSNYGNYRSLDRTLPGGRRVAGKPLTVRTSNKGYGLVDLRDSTGKKVTRSAHKPLLEAFAGPCPPGMEARHADDNGRNNRWEPGTEDESRARGGNLFWGTKAEQQRDKARNGGLRPPPGPTYECVNHAQCGAMVHKEGRRCVSCVDDMGREAAARLSAGENLLKVAQSYGYEGTRWTLRQAQKHGYAGTEAQALSQGVQMSPEQERESLAWAQRVINVVKTRRRRAPTGDAVSHQAPAHERNRAPRPLRGVSPEQRSGQSRTNTDPSVAERDRPKVTERSHIPYPAELVAKRDERARGGTSRRSR